ncbi:tetratricopeptide repeat protein [Anaerolineae bacterium CFX9]|nr:tetratricopeptide repeat protein [Anaerolineae bacterium CFX9]
MAAALSPQLLERAAHRHATFYLERLRNASRLYAGGGSSSTIGLRQFDQDRAQIAQGYAFLTTRAEKQPSDREALQLCVAFPLAGGDLLPLRLTLNERIAWLQTASEAAEKTGDQASLMTLHNLLGEALLLRNHTEESRAQYERALELAQYHRDLKNEADARVGLGRIDLLTPKSRDAAREHLLRALEIYTSRSDVASMGWARLNLANLDQRMKRFEDARQNTEHAIDAYRSIGARREIAVALRRLGSIYEQQGDYASAKHAIHEALEIARDMDAAHVLSACLQTLGLIATFEQNNAEGRTLFEEALEICQRNAFDRDTANCYVNLGWIANSEGDLETALRHYEAALAIYRTAQFAMRIATTLAQVAFLRARLHMAEAARSAAIETAAIAQEQEASEELLCALLTFALLRHQEGNDADATAWYGLVRAHPDAESEEVREMLRDLRSVLSGALGEEMLETGAAAGEALSLGDVLSRVMA